MAIQFRVVEVEFKNCDTGMATERGITKFSSPISTAQVLLRGFSIGFEKDEKKIQQIIIEVGDAVVEGSDVSFQVNFGIKDKSGHFDDPYGGQVTVLVIAD